MNNLKPIIGIFSVLVLAACATVDQNKVDRNIRKTGGKTVTYTAYGTTEITMISDNDISVKVVEIQEDLVTNICEIGATEKGGHTWKIGELTNDTVVIVNTEKERFSLPITPLQEYAIRTYLADEGNPYTFVSRASEAQGALCDFLQNDGKVKPGTMAQR